jgi:hypothetical protein
LEMKPHSTRIDGTLPFRQTYHLVPGAQDSALGFAGQLDRRAYPATHRPSRPT